MMALICDAHVHLYPDYSLELAFQAAEQNLVRLYAGARKIDPALPEIPAQFVLCLTERHDCAMFAGIAGRSVVLPAGYELCPPEEPNRLSLRTPSGRKLDIIAGRQIVTRERLELLAFGTDQRIPDGAPYAEGADLVRQAGGIPVLNWAPGKWLFRRRPLAEAIIKEAAAGTLLLCDTTLRPLLWGEPQLMKFGREKGLGVLAGSDPLPQPGEAARIGSYGLAINADLPGDKLLAGLKSLLAKPFPPLLKVGKRSNPAETALRIFTHMRSKH